MVRALRRLERPDLREFPMTLPDLPEHSEPAAAAPHAGNDAAPAPHERVDASDAHEKDDDEGDASGDEKAAGPEGATTGDAPKKRRRRRRKSAAQRAAEGGAVPAAGGETSGEATQGAVAADGAPAAEGGAPKDGRRDPKKHPKKEKRDRPPRDASRERPAFNVGDVVFGKILDIGDDAILIDLSGKGRAVFDKLELLLPEDSPEEIERDARRAEAEAEAIMTAGKEPVEGAPADGQSEVSDATGEAAQTESDTATSAHERRIIVAAAAIEAPLVSEGPTTLESATDVDGHTIAEAATDVSAEPAAVAASTEETKTPSLPKVVLEAGAPFVGVVHNDGGRGGYVVLTHHPRRASKAKPAVAAALKNKTEVYGLVTGVIKGGVEVDIDGVRAFAPGSHMDLRLGADLGHLIGKRLPFQVTQYGKRGRDVVLSRRSMLASESKAAREHALASLTPETTVDGVVKSVVSFGAFIDVGGIEGLVPLTEMSHNRGDRPSDVFKAGETVQVKILRVDEKGKVWLSRKATMPDPWAEATKKYSVGTKHTGKIVRLQPFGAFIELETGIDGLIHAADLSMKRFEHPSEVVNVGDPIDVVVSSIDLGTHKIALHPAPTGAAASEEPQRVQIHKVLKVQVVAIEAGGLVVRVLGATGRSARGFITSMATGTPRGTELRKIFPIGKELDAKVMEIDPRRGEAKLSIKSMHEETERNAYQSYRQQVKREAKFGTFADLLAKKNVPQK
jgi:small subunit ribosomal protein S1